MKRIGKKIIPLFLVLLILVGVPLSSYDEVKATGAEEFLYYTYWDLMNSLYAMTGYDMKISESEIKNHGVSGKQAWNNFTTFVEYAAKIHWKAFSEAGSAAMKELKNLVNTATEKGISISQDLYDMLKDVFGYQVVTGSSGNSSPTSYDLDKINALLGVSGYSAASYRVGDVIYSLNQPDSKFNMCSEGGRLFIFPSSVEYHLEYFGFRGLMGSDSSGHYQVIVGQYVYADDRYKEIYTGNLDSDWSNRDVQWLVKEGVWVTPDEIKAQVSTGACPQEVPDVSPWIKNPSIPDEWRIVKPGEMPDPDNDNGDALPVVIPIHPTPDKPDKPDGTEKEDSTEKSDNDLGVLINPSTGNQIDPNTGLDIDPDTGYLIDPDTGELIDPKTGKKVDKDKIKNRVKNLPSIVDRAGNITKYFPFCIPWDMMELVKTLKADKKAPRFTFKYTFKEINYTWVVDVDMADYWKYIKIFRWGMTIFFIIGLFFLTTKITTFVHRMSG